MTSTTDIATQVEAWAADVLGINTYPDNPEELGSALPVAVGDVTRKRVANSDTNFPAYEQPLLKLWDVRITLIVNPDPVWTQTQTLYDHADALEAALRKDRTLGSRVESAVPTHEAEFPGEVTHPSGVVGRAAILTVIVGELVSEV